jgi:hypothetical protein
MIRLAINVCMWCGKDSGLVIGKKLITDESEALPRRAMFDPCPCTECKEHMAKGITCVEVSPHADGYELQFQCKMTGRWVIAKEEAVRCWFADWYGADNVDKEMEKVLKNTPPMMLFHTGLFESLFGEAMKNNEPQ